MATVKLLMFLVVLLSIVYSVSATHFRFGTISWRIPDTTQPNVVEFYSSFTFRRSFFGKPNVGSTINPGTFGFGDGSAAVQLYLLISSIDLTADWASGTFTTTHVYPAGVAKNYTAIHTSAGRILELNNNPNQNWNVTCTVSILRYVTDKYGVQTLNTAPVSNNLPIVSVYSSEVNTFRVTASDPEGQNLTFSLGTPLDMGSKSLTLVPKLTVSPSGIVTFDTNGVANGYWCTQIKFSDGFCYAVVDFLIYVAPRPKVCGLTCNNKGASCSLDNGCTGCTNSTGKCVIAQPPYLVSPPTPEDGSAFSVNVGDSLSYSWSAFTPNEDSTVTITTGSLPTGAVLTTTLTGNPTNQTLTWTPQLADVGVYVITLGCRDSSGQSCQGQVSFSVNVLRPFCGYGTIAPAGCNPTTSSNCYCVCQAGFDPALNCYDCLSGNYGSSCTTCPPCVNGVCNEGFSGAGGCICNVGWQGANCSSPLNKPCDTTVANYVMTNVSTGPYVNPSLINTYMSSTSKTSLTLKLNTAMSGPTKLDVLLLIDVSKSITSAMFSFLSDTYAKTFFGNVRGLVTNSYFGVATFTDQPKGTGCSSSDYPFRLHLPLSSDQSDFVGALSTYMKITTLGCDDTVSKNDAQLDALYGSASSSVGWRTDAYHIVIVVTDSVFWEGAGYSSGSVYANRSDVFSAMAAANVQPIFIGPSGIKSTYNSLITSLGFGIYESIAADYSNVYTVAYAQIQALLKILSTVVVSDPYGFVTSVNAKQTGITMPSNRTSNVVLKYPSKNLDTVANYPEIVIGLMGWGTSTIVAQVNRAPVPSVCSITTREDITADVPITASDADGNALKVYLTTLPTLGTLYVNKSTTVKVARNTAYTIPDGNPFAYFSYVPNLHVYGSDSFSYYITDGCSTTSTISCSIGITFYDYPPVSTSATTNTTENVPAVVTMVGSDVETPASGLVFIITSLPDPSLGVLRRVSSNNLVVVNEAFSAGENTVRFVPVTYACCDIATFNFQVRDASGQMSTSASVGIDIIGVNQGPTPAASNANVERGVRTAIPIGAYDPDRSDVVTFIVTAYTSAGTGYAFTNTAGNALPTTFPFNLAAVTVDANGNAAAAFYYKSPVDQTGSNFASLTYRVVDVAGNTSATITVSIGVNSANRAPTANPAGPIPVFQDSQSAVWNLNGTDLDAADASSLKVQITALPTKGTLTQVGTGDISAGATLPFLLNNPNVYYRTTQTGEDTFAFRVVDLLGATSTQQVVRVIITAVNHAPTASFNPVSTPEDTPITLQVAPYDQDGDTLSVVITSLSRGNLYQFNGAQINTFPTTITDSQFRFKFQGNQDENGSPYATFTFYVDDNQGKPNSQSSVVTGTVTVTPVNDPPVPQAFTLTLLENAAPTSFVLTATDVETPSTVAAFLVSQPLSTLGTIKDANGNALDVRTLVPAPRTVYFHPNPYQYGTTTFTFGANDGTVDSDVTATATIVVTHVNHAPTASATSPVTATRSVPLTIMLTGRDNDINDILTVIITSFTGPGTLTFGSTNIPSNTPFTIPTTLTIPSTNSRSMTLSYLAPATATPGAGYASFTFTVTDQGNLASAATTVSISVANNNPPVANPAGPLPVTQDLTSAALTLSGTDVDVADANSLTVVILSLPTLGTLYQGSSSTSISSPSDLPAAVTTVSYSTTRRGTDSFTFAVRDLLGAVSAPITVTIPITNTNHAPSALWVGTAVANEDTTLVITNMQASDPDSDPISIFIAQQPTPGTLTQFDNTPCASYPCLITDSSNRMKFTPALNGNSINNAAYATISFYASDGPATSSTVVGNIFITPVNDAPVASGSSVSTLENTNLVITLGASDVDTPLDQVFVTIQTIPASSIGTITDMFGTTLKIGDVLTGSLVKQVTFKPTKWANGNTAFSFYLNDGQLSSNTATVSVTVTPVRQDPICSVAPGTTVTVAIPSTTDVQLMVFDPDQGESYTFSMVTFNKQNGGSLNYPNGGAALSSSTTVIKSGVTTTNMYGSVELEYIVSSSDSNTHLEVTFVVSDGSGSSSVCRMDFASSLNQAPIATPVAPLTTLEEVSTPPIHLDGTDTDNGGAPLTVIIVDLPQHGVLYDSSNNAITTPQTQLTYNTFDIVYTPNNLFHGSDSFTFTVKDAAGTTAPKSKVDITVTHVNHNPSIFAGADVQTNEDTTVVITQVLASDPDGDPVTVWIRSPPANGQFAQADGTLISNTGTFPVQLTSTSYAFKFIPAANANGNGYASFTVFAKDNAGGTSTDATANINVIAVDDSPVATDVSVTLNEQVTVSGVAFTLTATDVDTPQASISATILSLPASSLGTVTLNDGVTPVSIGDVISNPRTLQFIPIAYTFGTTSFSFKVQDLTSYSANIGQVSITVTHVNHDPSTDNVAATAVRGVPLTITLTGTDPDAADTFTFTIVSITPGAGGAFSSSTGTQLTAAGQVISSGVANTASRTFSTKLTYTAPVTATGNAFASITFHVSDQASGVSTDKTLTIGIAPNSAPIAVPVTVSATQDAVSSPVALTGTDADPADSNTLQLVITTLPKQGVLILDANTNVTAINTALPAGTSVSYYTTSRGSDTFYYYVKDNLGSVSGTVSAEITITPVNHAPTAAFHGPATAAEDNNVVITQISTSDPDGDAVQIYVTALPATGSLTQYDGTLITAASSSAPVLVTDSHGWLVYIPVANANGDPIAAFSFYGDDGQGALNSKTPTITGNIAVTPVNDAPVAINGVTAANENSDPITISLAVSDIDTALSSVSVYLTSLPDRNIGTLYDISTGQPVQLLASIPSRQLQLVLVKFANGNTQFTFFANDGQLDSLTSATQVINIASVNQAPTASAATPVNAQRTVATAITLEAFDDDTPEFFNFTVVSYSALGGHFSFNGVNFKDISATPFVLQANVAKSVNGNNLVIYFTAPNNNFGDNFAQISLQVVDAAGAASAITSVSVNVLPGTKPTANPAGPITFNEEATSSSFALTGTDVDVADQGSLSILIATLPTKATLYVQGTNGGADTAVTVAGTLLHNPTVYLVGNTLSYGSDLFTFSAVDLVNTTSTPVTVQLTIVHANHPPVAGVSISTGNMNNKLAFNVFGQDPDLDIPLSIYITQLPAVGTLYQGDGITVVPASTSQATPTLVTDFNGKMIYVPPVNGYGTPITTFSIYVDDNSGASNSKSTTLTTDINVNRMDLPPSTSNFTLSMPQNGQLSFRIAVTDPQSYPTTITILTFPLYGNLYRPDGSEISSANPTVLATSNITYIPPKKAFDNGATPYATITYRATADASGLTSNVAIGTISVYQAFGAPVFTGQTVYDMPDNTNLTMLLTGYSETGNYGIQILSVVASDRGVLYTKTCMGDEMCSMIYATKDNLPFVMDSPEMEYVLRYTPPTDQSGQAFANFTLIVTDSYGQSEPVTITINIYHINIPPIIVPWTYDTQGATYNWSNAIVNIIESNDAVIAWKITDRDTPQSNLTALVYGLPYRGYLFYASETASGFVAGAPLTKSGSIVNSSSDGLFRIVYRPEPGKSGQNYATFSLMGFDQIDQSTRISLKVNVKHINLAPTVNVLIPEWNTTTNSSVIVTGVSINDTDASFYKEMFQLSLAQADGTPAGGAYLDLITFTSSCTRFDNTTLGCNATLADLNKLLTQISVSVTVQGSYTLTIYANDLGAGSADHTPADYLSATDYVNIQASKGDASSTSSPGGSSVMTAVVAAAAGAGAASAFGAWRYMKKKSPPTIDFFGMESVDHHVTNNPLFEEGQAMSFSNALYEEASAVSST